MDNPYSAPATSLDRPALSREEIKRELSRPSTALIIMSSIHAVFDTIGIIGLLPTISATSYSRHNLFNFSLIVVHFTCLILISIGAAKMGHLESRRWAWLGAVLACVPVMTPFLFFGIPFGIWAIMLLKRPNVKQAFIK